MNVSLVLFSSIFPRFVVAGLLLLPQWRGPSNLAAAEKERWTQLSEMRLALCHLLYPIA